MKLTTIALAALLTGAAAPASPGCEVEGSGDALPTTADAARARAACETARSRFAELFGDPVPEARVILWDRPGYRIGLKGREATIFWPTSQVMAERAVSAAAAEKHVAEQWRDVLPHEISHVLLAARFYADGRGAAPGGYGTPLPDWLDEGVAICAESLEQRSVRLKQARELPAARRELRSILAGAHPATTNVAAFAIRDGGALPNDEALWSFYPQSIAVLAFVYDTGGPDAVRELARRLVADPGAADALAGLPGLPAAMDRVVAAWEEWLKGRG